jgi:hypothetical protein
MILKKIYFKNKIFLNIFCYFNHILSQPYTLFDDYNNQTNIFSGLWIQSLEKIEIQYFIWNNNLFYNFDKNMSLQTQIDKTKNINYINSVYRFK